MKQKQGTTTLVVLAYAVLFAAGLFLVISCSVSQDHGQNTPENEETTEKQDNTGDDQVVNKTGAQLWSENCNRCHNTRQPDEFSDAEWEVVTHHMRDRANLTAEEHRKILEFLKSSN